MTKLVRTRSSGFQLEYAHTLSEIEEAVKTGKIEEWIIPIEKVFLKYQKAVKKSSKQPCDRNREALLRCSVSERFFRHR